MNEVTPLQERIWEAVAEVRDQHPRVFNDAPTDDVVAAVLPIIAAKVRKAQADAWDEGREAGIGDAEYARALGKPTVPTINPYREKED